MQTAVQLPRYKCHKEVRALKIAGIAHAVLPEFKGPTCRGCFALGSACGHCERCTWETQYGAKPTVLITPAEKGYSPFLVPRAFFDKHKPEVGGYYVQYADGYESFSPAQAFEEGYTLIA